MIAEGVIASLVWCTVGLSFYENLGELLAATQQGSPSKVVYDSSIYFLGTIGGVFAVLGVVTYYFRRYSIPFRLFDYCGVLKIEQRTLVKRLLIAVPLFAVGFWIIASKIDFGVLWRYFTWANQATAMVMLHGQLRLIYIVTINSIGCVLFRQRLLVRYVLHT